MEGVPRDPSHYSPTTHSKQQRKHRQIPWDAVGETIREGRIKQSHKPNCVLFVHDVGLRHPVGVIANYKDGGVLTIEWRTK